jgi:CBS domain-containing protein
MPRLRDVMREGFLTIVQAGDSVSDACETMARLNVGIVAVADGERLLGVFSERDVVQRVVVRELDPRAVRVCDVMTTEVLTADENEDCHRAMETMVEANIRHLPVTRGARLVSMLSIRDLMRSEMEELRHEYREMHAYLYSVSPEGPHR